MALLLAEHEAAAPSAAGEAGAIDPIMQAAAATAAAAPSQPMPLITAHELLQARLGDVFVSAGFVRFVCLFVCLFVRFLFVCLFVLFVLHA